MKIFKKIINTLSGKKEEIHCPLKEIKQSISPNCPLHVSVEEAENCTYMYLYELDGEEPKRITGAVWIRNHLESPSDFEISNMKKGLPSMLPTEFCSHPKGKPKLDPDNLKFVWFEEGDGVALLENNDIICVMPVWSKGLSPVYSKDCIKEHELLFPLKKNNILIARIRKAQEFWKSILEDHENWWENFMTPRLKILQKYFGEYRNYYAIDGGKWPAKALLRYEVGDMTYLITLGVAIIPQPQVEMYTENPEKVRRIELGLAIETKKLMKNEKEFCILMSSITNMPWRDIKWLGHGHTLDVSCYLPLNNKSSDMVLVDGKMDKTLPNINFLKYRGDPINVLWLKSISKSDFAFIKKNGIEKFLKKRE